MSFGNNMLQGQIAVVTGSTSGIGEATAKLFTSQGAKVVISGRRAERGAQVVDAIREAGGEASFIRTDVSKPEDLRNLIDGAVNLYGKLDILVNNAGIELTKPIADTTLEEYTRIMDTNLRGYFLATMYALEYMRKQKRGNILSINSISSVQCGPGVGLYSMAKAAIRAMTKSIAYECAKEGIRANDICPGLIQTEIFLAPEAMKLAQLGVSLTPAGRIGTPEEVAYAALYMVSDVAGFTTGAQLIVDDGKTLG